MKYLLIFLFLSPLCLSAQGIAIRGIVVESGNNQLVPAASVFINNSTFGAICDNEGRFAIQSYPALPFELVVTAIGYESKTVTVAETDQLLSVKLAPKVFDLEAVDVISPEKDGWAKFGENFMEEFVGYSAYAGACKLLNKDALRFYWDKENMVLKVSADAPLKIENNAMGYRITYWLEDFELNYVTRKLYFRGYSQFEEMQSKKARKMERWKSSRISAYKGSLYHFMRSLYKGDALCEGFEIRVLKRMAEAEVEKYKPQWSDTVSLGDTGEMKRLMADMYGNNPDPSVIINTFLRIKSWQSDSAMSEPLRLKGSPLHDSTVIREFRFAKLKDGQQHVIVRYFESKNEDITSVVEATVLEDENNGPKIKISGDNGAGDRPVVKMMYQAGADNTPGGLIISPELAKQLPVRQPKVQNVLFTAIVPLDSILKRNATGTATLGFNDYLHITYVYEAEEKEYFHKFFPALNTPPDKQESIISIAPGKTLLIMPEGNFRDSYDLLVEQYWAYEKLDKLLPVDFEP